MAQIYIWLPKSFTYNPIYAPTHLRQLDDDLGAFYWLWWQEVLLTGAQVWRVSYS